MGAFGRHFVAAYPKVLRVVRPGNRSVFAQITLPFRNPSSTCATIEAISTRHRGNTCLVVQVCLDRPWRIKGEDASIGLWLFH